MGMFISGKVAITAAGVTDEKDITTETDVIYIRPKMDYGTRQRVIGAATKVTAQKAKSSRRKATQDVTVDVGDYQIALLVHNVLGWAGPSFQGVACVAQNIEKLDSDFPIVAAVIQDRKSVV